jgi:ribose transport system substrate-binding protein
MCLGFNDDTAMGALMAARDLGREKDVVIVGQGVAPVVRDELRDPHSHIMGSTAFWPEQYGERLIALAGKILTGEHVPNAVTMQHIFVTSENIDQYYPKNPK